MTNKVFKYPLRHTREQTVKMKGRPQILAVQVQHGTLCIWAHVDDDATYDTDRTFMIFGTGEDVPDGLVYVATCQSHNGNYVWHLFEEVS